MLTLRALTWLLPLVSHEVSALSSQTVSKELGPDLSKSASITGGDSPKYPRWSKYSPPTPGVIVNAASEEDVATTVKYCTSNNIPFLTQNGGHGWAKWDFGEEGIVVNIKDLNSIAFNDNKTQVTIGGGVAIEEVVAVASKQDVLVPTGNCPCVGTMGAVLGGGYGNLLGLHGLGVDNVLSLNVVLADGSLQTVTPDDEDLFWALRGAGPNFGIVTSATLKSFPASSADQTAWFGQLIYTEDKLEEVINTLNDITLEPRMNAFLYYMASSGTPSVVITPFYHGTEEEGRAAFKPFLDIGPTDDTMAELQYAHWTDASQDFCTKGGYKPSFTAGLAQMDAGTWREVWDEWTSWLSHNNTSNSLVMVEAYSLKEARKLSQSSSSFAWRNKVNFNAVVIPWYYDAGLESEALAFGTKLRELWRKTDGLDAPAAYINFAHGDESSAEIYGENVDRLKSIKATVDPENVFSYWFDL
ncbi:FAD-binding domain-containing protein [Aspergillus steynii IBT 23096]|uniref:FAD-binding domain-containing protein n=1 Tax=Aspergillus steynii IBT 23096 TaxID=1392250 RepID=A0A2I2GI97_9EURO|nr:FAD-binding domain-containing protein [Aspergillus steynii IBT 23096]PLB52594.1 FAD-binding domain-containing protein [Aspergillus steynii IBT 23096]